jgi:hypothetical protein
MSWVENNNHIESSDKSLDDKVKEDWKEKGKEIKDATTKDPTVANNFAKTGAEIVKDIESGQKVNELINKIDTNPELVDPQNESKVKSFTEAIKQWNYSEAITILFDFLKGVMWPSDNPESTFWFKDNKEINDFLEWLSKNVDTMSITELESQKDKLFAKIESSQWIKKKLWLTYAVSRLLDEIVYKKEPNKKRMKWSSDWWSNKTANELSIARMAQSVKPGDILAVNKSEQKTGDKLLTQLVDGDTDTSHVLVVTAVDPESGTITVAHSTGSKVNSTWSGVETEVSFSQYADQFNGLAIATLRPPTWVANTLVKNVLSKDGSWYDKFAAASTALTWSNFSNNNNNYNCVELIAQSFPNNVQNERKNRTHPSQMLKNMNPAYVTIAGKSIGGS